MSKFIKSQRGGDLLSYRGFRFRRNGAGSPFSQPWRCVVEKCKGKAQTPKPYHDDCRVILSGTHSHTSDLAKEELALMRNEVKERAGEGLAPRRIISEEAIGLSQEARGRLEPKNLKRTIQRVRNEIGGLPPNPQPGQHFMLPERFKVTSNGSRFLLYDNGPEDEVENDAEEYPPRIIMFSSENQLRILRGVQNIFFDGTFKVSPHLFYQLFTIHALRNGVCMPCVFCLLQNKTQETYTTVFTIIREHLPREWKPLSAMCDFELATMRAFVTVFPEVALTGCFFHLNQSVYRQAVERGLKRGYDEDEVLRKHIKYLAALTFVPENDVLDSFHTIQEAEEFPQDNESLVDLYDYFETIYLGRAQRGGRRRAPRYSLNLWNQLERLEGELPRTNNLIEGWHRGCQASLDGEHPSVWKCITFLQTEEDLVRTTNEQITAGQTIRKERKEQKKRTERIQAIVRDYNNRDRLDFLRAVTYNFNMNV